MAGSVALRPASKNLQESGRSMRDAAMAATRDKAGVGAVWFNVGFRAKLVML